MVNSATPNLPSSDFEKTARFYADLGFSEDYRGDDWMILERDGVVLEFFSYPGVDPLSSSFSCCLRLDDVDGFYGVCKAAGIPEAVMGQPRLHPLENEDWGRMGALIDPDGTLLRLIGNQ
ncbi:bleomycin resistance protein [Phyllobacterium myrsinacearum]|uniref:Bleomycin resistance protein n=1 Tax=Phyllobacterium myrsinacearum TaxID=28101 RepID=A0A839EFQ9_9HYPH|nr:bleomycin resistance protein [Phyllobacterium myrsinacearum]MBA8877609.1 catechol 2,3-dioxygenase-like lactoylglutathione lyase family enzyme [Phyllobacterium myrsinacearum]